MADSRPPPSPRHNASTTDNNPSSASPSLLLPQNKSNNNNNIHNMSATAAASAIAANASFGSAGSSSANSTVVVDNNNNTNNNNMDNDPLAHLDGLNDFLHVDDLLSLSNSPQHNNTAAATTTTAGSGSASTASDHHHEDDTTEELWHVHHPGVHMHLQDNAKLPTFNLVVNRSAVRSARADSLGGDSQGGGSIAGALSALLTSGTTAKRQEESGFSKLRPPTLVVSSSSSSSKPLGSGNPNNNNHNHHHNDAAAELFLNRSNRHADYRGSGSSYHSRGTSGGVAAVTGGGGLDPLDALLAADLQDVDPTPLSEIKRRHETYQAQHPAPDPQQQQQPPQALAAAGAVTPSAATTAASPNLKTTPKPILPGSKQTTTNNTNATTTNPLPKPPPSKLRQGSRGGAYAVRPVPLPIPTKKISPPGSPKKNGVVNPAAVQTQPNTAIAASNNRTVASATTTTARTLQPQQLAQTTTTTNKQHIPQPSKAAFPVTKAYSNAPAPAIHRASTQKAQYGFGSNHTVASVPPLVVTSRKRKPGAAVAATAKTMTSTPSAAGAAAAGTYSVSSAHASSAHNHHNNNHQNQGAAYERKKQRAKDARVKLNESIERLSIAIGLAGTQSRERLQQWNALAASNLIGRQAGLDICNECVGTAESAKKWDRPSFVGSAASLIQQLNAQCEALMRELVSVHQQHESDLGRVVHPQPDEEDELQEEDLATATTTESPLVEAAATEAALAAVVVNEETVATEQASSVSVNNSDGTTTTSMDVCPPSEGLSHPVPAAAVVPPAVAETALDAHDSKRQRIEATAAHRIRNGVASTAHNSYALTNQAQQLPVSPVHHAVFMEPKLMTRVASFLDPLSLSRCLRVSKTFKSMNAFTGEQVWQDLSAARFGFFNVRQWHAKLDDEDMGISAPSTFLYRSMDRANVMPTFTHEGMFLLGEARLPNKVSAWSFLVERSNGETLRSTRRRPDMPGKGDYTSLPIVEIRTVIQNTGCSSRGNEHIAIRDQTLTVDASTRRRGEEMKEVDWDDRFKKRLENLDGTPYVPPPNRKLQFSPNRSRDLAQLRLYESVVIVSYIYARGCSTNSKFVQRSNFSKILVGLTTGVTLPLVIPFPRDASHLQH